MMQLHKIFAASVCVLALSTAVAAAQQTPSPGAQETPSPSPSPQATPTGPPPPPTIAPSATPSAAPLSASPASVASNVGVSQTISISGATGALNATLDQKIAGVTIEGNTVTLAPIRNGTATLHVVDASSGSAVDVPVRVAPNAGTIAPQVALRVTGENVDPSFVALQASLALNRATSSQPGATVQIGQVSPPPAPLATGAQATFNVPVSIAGGDQYLDVNGTTQITVQNVAAPPFEPAVLYYSDDPERILNDGVLYRGTVTAAQAVRLYDYHENGQQPRRLVVALTGASTSTTTVQVVEHFAGPNIDVMTVGHTVTKNFLVNKARNQGTLVDITGGAPLFAHDVLMRNREGVASAMDLRVVAGGPVTITVLAVSPGVNPATLLDAPALPGDGRNRHGVFSLANYGTATLTYTAGGRDVSATIGDREPTVPRAGSADPGNDFGDYGVLFNLNFTLTNPSDASTTAYLYEAPRGGPARASYLIDNDPQPQDLGCATSARSATDIPHRYQIRAFTLPPHATETHVVRTMTDGGSNLPLDIGATGTPPQPATPPISGPDGCFPKPQAPATTTPVPSPTPTPAPPATP